MKKLAIALVFLMLLAFVTGCSAKKDSYKTEVSFPSSPSAAYNTGASGKHISGISATGSDFSPETGSTVATTDLSPDFGGRKVILNYELEIRALDFDAEFAAINNLMVSCGGYVQHSSVSGEKPDVVGDSGRYASFVLRIPKDRADEFLSGVRSNSKVISFHSDSDDVTNSYFDLETRLSVLNIQHERLTAILVQTDNLSDIIELERAIADVMIQIEGLTGQLRRYDALIDYNTVTIHLHEQTLRVGRADELTVWERIGLGFSATLSNLSRDMQNFFVWFIVNIPYILIWGVIIFGVTFGLIRIVRANKKRKAEKNNPPTENKE